MIIYKEKNWAVSEEDYGLVIHHTHETAGDDWFIESFYAEYHHCPICKEEPPTQISGLLMLTYLRKPTLVRRMKTKETEYLYFA